MNTIQDKVIALGQIISAPDVLLSVPTVSPQNGKAHVEIGDGAYHLVTAERGFEIKRQKFETMDALLYSIFQSITFEMASDFELKNRVSSQDSRILLFEKQLDLLARLSTTWSKVRRDEINKILAQNPYVSSTA